MFATWKFYSESGQKSNDNETGVRRTRFNVRAKAEEVSVNNAESFVDAQLCHFRSELEEFQELDSGFLK